MDKNWREHVYHKKADNVFPDDWELIRIAVKSRYKDKCYRCEKKKPLTIHHIIPRADGGGDNLENLIPLCISCHDLVEIEGYKTKVEIQAYEETKIKKRKVKKVSKTFGTDLDRERPEWHKYVYGGVRRTNR